MSIRIGSHLKLVIAAAVVAAAFAGALALASTGAGAHATFSYPSSACPEGETGLEDCIAAAAAGDTIKVDEGVYYESDIDIDKPITVRGSCDDDDDDRAVVDAAVPAPPEPGESDIGFDVAADDVTIRCLTIRHATTAVEARKAFDVNGLSVDRLQVIDSDTAGVDVKGDGFKIERSEFNGGKLRAIQTEGNDGELLKNRVSNFGQGCFNLAGNTVRVEGNTASLCEDEPAFSIVGDANTIRKNIGRLADALCIEVTGDDNSLRENLALSCGSGGILASGANPVVEKNRAAGGFSDNAITVECSTTCHEGRVAGNSAEGVNNDADGFAIAIDPGDTPCSTVPFPCFRVTGNTSSMNIEEGFVLELSSALIRDNRATLNGSEGDAGFLITGNENAIERNSAKENAYSGLTVEGDGNTLKDNSATENGVDGIRLLSGATNTLDGNRAKYNQGDGIENDGDDTEITDNVSKGNRADCVGDGTTASEPSGNLCADGTDFTTGGTIEE